MPLQWPQIDRAVGTIRLEPGTTKNQGGRTIAYAEIDELREVIDEGSQAREVLQQRGEDGVGHRRYDIVTDADLHEAADKLNRSIKTVTRSVTMGRAGVKRPSRAFRVSS